MSSEREVLTPERVARVFQDAGYEVSQVVGEKPGTVDFFATKRTGFERSKTYFEVWESCPGAGELDEAIARLEERRKARKADRALGVVPTGSLPAGYVSVWEGRTAEVVTWKRLVLEVSGFVELVRKQVLEYASSNEERYYFPHQIKLSSGEVVDALEMIEGWLVAPPPTVLSFHHYRAQDFGGLARKARHQNARGWLQDPDRRFLICRDDTLETLLVTHIDIDFIVRTGTDDDVVLVSPFLLLSDMMKFEMYDALPDASDDVQHWFLARMSSDVLRRRFVDARTNDARFREFSDASVNARALLNVFDGARSDLEGVDGVQWVARVLHCYMGLLLESVSVRSRIGLWEDAALEQFALDVSPRELNDRLENISLGLREEHYWLDARGNSAYAFDDPLVLHYFIARKIASERDLLNRYQFPREYVLLFLALISPETAAMAVADRSEAIRKEIEDEVERRLQLTIGHQVRRSAGAIRAQFNVIKRRFRPEDLQAFEYEIGRIDQEIDFLRALAEQTRRWHEVPEAAITAVPIEGVVRSSLERIALQYPAIAHVIDVDTSLRIRASADVFREVIESLVENAFQAVAFGAAIATPRIAVRARLEGETVRIDVVDNGPGIPARDRERIFDLYVTTKKGGDKPLGTGMGLPIARKYAQHVGGMVALDPDQTGGTCFFARFVVWKETS